MINIGTRIKELRSETGLTQSQLADKIDISAQVLSNIERGMTLPKTDLIKKLSKYFNVPSDYLIGKTLTRWAADAPYERTSVLSCRMRDRMSQLQLTCSDLAAMVNIPAETMHEILENITKPNVDTLTAIAIALQTTVLFLSGTTDYWTAIQNEDEQDIVLYYRTLSKSEKRIFMGNFEQMKEGR